MLSCVAGKLRSTPFGTAGMLTRRSDFILLLVSLGQLARAEPVFGGKEWTRRFREFMKELNEFIIELNDSKLDERKWKRVCQAWSEINRP
jgi:hypothetical protein